MANPRHTNRPADQFDACLNRRQSNAGDSAVRQPEAPAHRRDIDGLRAVAVLAVLAYHVGIHFVRGGYVGVDIFFVISGYLITQIVCREISQERFSLTTFYERRIRRIFPALAVMAALTFAVELAIALPSEFVDFSRSLAAVAASASNFYFWWTSGYFAAQSTTKPLLHTWSLAVEEQFYLLWPLLLMLFSRRFSLAQVRVAACCIAALSFFVSAIGAFRNPDATFYLVHTRAWELLFGGLLSMGAFPRKLGPLERNLYASLGAILIGGAILLTSTGLPFPGLLALPPCLGAALLILAGRDGTTVVGRLLSMRPIAFIGTISYSLYLWHWPLVVFQQNNALLTHTPSEHIKKVILIAWSLMLAILSWKFIEEPFRNGPRRPSRKVLYRFAAGASVVLLVLGLVGMTTGGIPSRYSAEDLRIAAFLKYDATGPLRVGKCFLVDSSVPQLASECMAASTSKPNFLLLGDSHAADLWPGLQAVYPEINFLQATASDCFPTIWHSWSEASRCTRIIDSVFNDFLARNRPDMVILSARWRDDSLAPLELTLRHLTDRHVPVTLMGPSVIYDEPLPRLLLQARQHNDPSIPDRHWDRSEIVLDRQLEQMAARYGTPYISLLELACEGGHCQYADEQGMPLFPDRDHFTAEGSAMVARAMRARGLWIQQPPTTGRANRP